MTCSLSVPTPVEGIYYYYIWTPRWTGDERKKTGPIVLCTSKYTNTFGEHLVEVQRKRHWHLGVQVGWICVRGPWARRKWDTDPGTKAVPVVQLDRDFLLIGIQVSGIHHTCEQLTLYHVTLFIFKSANQSFWRCCRRYELEPCRIFVQLSVENKYINGWVLCTISLGHKFLKVEKISQFSNSR